MIDYHVHTMLCNHAVGVMKEYVQKAVQIGLKEICFLDHLIISDTKKRISMSPEEVPLYFQAIQRLKHEYKDVIKVKAGLEIDFDPKHMDHVQEIINSYSFDVVGCSIHFLGFLDIVSSDSDWKHGKIDPEFVYDLYISQLKKMLNYNCFDIICHMDLVKKYGHKSIKPYDREYADIIEKIKQIDIAVELNTAGYSHLTGEPYPSPELLNKLSKAEIPVTLGSDSHKPDQLGRYYDKALELLDAAGYKQLATFTNRKREMIPIV